MTVGEGPGITPENAGDYLDLGLNMIFHFGHMFLDQGAGGRFDPIPWSIADFIKVFKTWDDAFEIEGWGSVFLGNHDFARMVSRWGDDKTYWEKSSKLLCTLILSMRGTPFIFQGDEIGMTNTELRSIDESKDIETQNGWEDARKRGVTETEFLAIANYSGRDNARTPVQWDDSLHAGFTGGTPWMGVNRNKDFINVSAQRAESESVLTYFKQMIAFRKAHPILTYGQYKQRGGGDERLFVYTREQDEEKWCVVLNFSAVNVNFPTMLSPRHRTKLIGNYPGDDATTIRPWEAMIYRL